MGRWVGGWMDAEKFKFAFLCVRFWNLIGSYQHFEETCCSISEDLGNISLRNVGKHMPNYTDSSCTRTKLNKFNLFSNVRQGEFTRFSGFTVSRSGNLRLSHIGIPPS
jgi:hypothetical protein